METKLTFSLDGSAAGLTTNSVVQVSTLMLSIMFLNLNETFLIKMHSNDYR